MPQLPQKIPPRIVIYAKDVQNITGRKERTARRILAQIRIHFNKQPTEFVTVQEFCLFTGLLEEEVRKFII
jgi:hypothetical protein